MGEAKSKVTFQNILAWILVGILAVLLVFQSVRKFDYSNYITDADTVVVYKPIHDTILVEVPVEVPVPYKVEVLTPSSTAADTFWMEIQDKDLIRIAKEYYKKKYYKDTITDEYLMAIIEEEIFANEVVRRKFSYSILQEKQTTITKQVDTRRGAIFVGPYAGTTDEKFGLGASILYQTKNDHMISLHGDVLNKGVYFSTYWKLTWPWEIKK